MNLVIGRYLVETLMLTDGAPPVNASLPAAATQSAAHAPLLSLPRQPSARLDVTAESASSFTYVIPSNNWMALVVMLFALVLILSWDLCHLARAGAPPLDRAEKPIDDDEDGSGSGKTFIVALICLLNFGGEAGYQLSITFLPQELEVHAGSAVYAGAVTAAWSLGFVVCTVVGPFMLRRIAPFTLVRVTVPLIIMANTITGLATQVSSGSLVVLMMCFGRLVQSGAVALNLIAADSTVVRMCKPELVTAVPRLRSNLSNQHPVATSSLPPCHPVETRTPY
jgi:hypothetical protein